MTITKPNIASLYKGNLPWFVENTIFTTLHGSHAYGTNIETSDIDVKGIFVLPKKNYYSVLESPEQVQLKEPDAVVFELRKFLKLAADCNPNIIEVLFTDESDWCSITPAGRLLVENKEKFLSTKIKHTFFGYAKSQLGRINLHYRWLKNPPAQPPTRTEFGLRENPELSRDQFGVVESQVKKKMEEWDVNWDELDFSEKVNIQTRISKMLAECKIVTSNDLWMAAAKLLGFEDNFLVYLQKEKEYRQKCADWDSYQEWKVKRNPQRSELEARYGFNTKHGMHLIRLMRMCKEVLTTGKVNVKRQDAEELLSIRRGNLSYEELIEYSNKLEDEIEQLYVKCNVLPKRPNLDFVDDLAMRIAEMVHK